MKVEELIEEINSKEFYCLWELEDESEIDFEFAKKRVARHLDLDEHRWYSTAVNVYKCEDGFVGVRGGFQSFSECQSWEDVGCSCYASEYKEVKTVTYERK